jgi:hypothetical protein
MDVKGEELRALYSDTTHRGSAPSFTENSGKIGTDPFYG